jgi:DNA-binding MarR family transcriptional regulator
VKLCEGRYGVTRREWRMLAVLAVHGPMLSTALATQAQLDPARTSRAVSSLVNKRLVDRVLVPNDHRKATLSLTANGQALYKTFFPQVVQLNQAMLSALAPEEVVVLDGLLSRLHAHTANMLSTMEMPKANRRRLDPNTKTSQK